MINIRSEIIYLGQDKFRFRVFMNHIDNPDRVMERYFDATDSSLRFYEENMKEAIFDLLKYFFINEEDK